MTPYKSQVLCIWILLMLGGMGIIDTRKKTEYQKTYRRMYFCVFIHLLTEVVSIYTIHHYDMVSSLMNRWGYIVFFISMNVAVCLMNVYILKLIQVKINIKNLRIIPWVIPFAGTVAALVFSPIRYIETEKGTYIYSAGSACCYISMFFYTMISFILMMQYRSRIEKRKQLMIWECIFFVLILTIIQMVLPRSFVSGAFLTVITLCIFLTLENPDRVRLESYINEKKRADQANKSKSEFIVNVSHELRTPLNTILGMDEMILRESNEKEVMEYAENIKSAGKMMLSLINDILDLSKLEAGKMEIVPAEYDVAQLVHDSLKLIDLKAKGKGLQIITDISPDVPKRLYGDERRIKQVITNIMNNAVKYTLKGNVTLKIGWELTGMNQINLMVAIKDTGIGIREENLDRLFAAFERIDEKHIHDVEGTGLGMSITVNLLKMMDSRLEVKSTYGKGSTFYFSLPQQIVSFERLGNYEESIITGAKVHSEKYKESFHAPDAKVLVVDDNNMNLTIIKGLLKKTDVQVITAASGEEALSLFSKEKFDMVLLDHLMPGMDGIETLNKMKESSDKENRQIPVIALTANAVNGAEQFYMEHGFDAFLSKPVSPTQLEHMMKEYLCKD